ncbi:hypothetical protein K439DRAFT_1611008 [Ramaria rubella]|nr:hypothetical protein K439DRAFT_1611008 [Ramaria rubella]
MHPNVPAGESNTNAMLTLGVPFPTGLNPCVALLNTMSIPPHPSRPIFQRGGGIKVDFRMLQIDKHQKNKIEQCYETNLNYHRLFSDDPISQQAAMVILRDQGLALSDLDDLGNSWSTHWSTRGGSGQKRFVHILLQW